MATENIEFGVNINVQGNYASALGQVTRSTKQAGEGVENFGKSVQQTDGLLAGSLGNLLALQSSLFVLTKAFDTVAQTSFGFLRNIGQGFVFAVKKSGDLEKATQTLKLVFKDSFGEAQERIRDIARRTPETQQTLTELSSRLSAVGISAKDLFQPLKPGQASGLENIAAGLSRLAGQDRVRAINSIGNAFQDINSFVRLFNTGVTQAERTKFSGLRSEVEKTRFIMDLFSKRFGGTFGPEGLANTLMFQYQRAVGELTTLISDAFKPAIAELTPILSEITNKLTALRDNKKAIEGISSAFKIVAKFAGFVFLGVWKIIQAVIKLAETFPKLTGFAIVLGVIGVAIIGVVAVLGKLLFSLVLVELAISKLGISTLMTTSTFRFFAGALGLANVKTLTLTASLWALAAPLLLVGSLIAAWNFAPTFLDNFKSILGWLKNMLIIVSTIVGAIAGFFLGGPIGAVIGGAAAFAGTTALFDAVMPAEQDPSRKQKPKAQQTASVDRMDNFINSQSPEAEELKKLREDFRNSRQDNEMTVNNSVILDGKVVAKSTNKFNRDEATRFPRTL